MKKNKGIREKDLSDIFPHNHETFPAKEMFHLFVPLHQKYF